MPQRPSASLLRFNEGKACDAVTRVLEQVYGGQRAEQSSPEQEGDPDPVDFAFRIGATRFAMEHTGIEPFEGHVHMNAQGATHLQPIIDQVAGRLPTTDRYELHMPVGALRTLGRRQLRTVQRALAEFVAQQAPSLPLAAPGRYVTPVVKHALPDVPFPVAVHRVSTLGIQEPFTIIQLVDGTLESQRQDRLRETCTRKFPKLARWKTKARARSVLVLEDNDMILTNAEYVWRAYAAAEASFADRPDDVYLVMTFVDDTWWVAPLRLGSRTYFDLDMEERITEWDPAKLVDLSSSLRRTP